MFTMTKESLKELIREAFLSVILETKEPKPTNKQNKKAFPPLKPNRISKDKK